MSSIQLALALSRTLQLCQALSSSVNLSRTLTSSIQLNLAQSDTGCARKELTLFAHFPSKSANKVNFFWDTLYLSSFTNCVSSSIQLSLAIMQVYASPTTQYFEYKRSCIFLTISVEQKQPKQNNDFFKYHSIINRPMRKHSYSICF